MRALLGWILALGLVVSPAVAKAGGAAGEDSPATAKTDKSAVSNAVPGTTAPVATSDAASAKPAAASMESEIDELRDVLQSQAKQIQEQNDALKQQQEKMQTLEKQLNGSSSSRETAAPATTTMASAAVPSASPIPAPSLPAPAAAPATPQAAAEEKPSPLYFNIGSAHFTPGGFLDLTNVFRTKTTGNGIGTNFGAIPYNNIFPGAGLTEDRFSAQNSRITLRADSKVAGGDAVGYVEADFLGNAATSLNVTSNANTLRMRVYFLDYRRPKWEILFGQDWSMLTANRNGIGFMPADVFNTQDMDTNYQLGLVWERTPQFRFILHPSKTVAFGISIENPEQYIPSTSAVVVPASFSTAQVNLGGTATTSNVAPDVIAKLAFDPKFGMHSAHFEVAGLYRVFRINSFTGATNFGNTTVNAGAIAVNSNFEIFKNFKLYETAFWSDGGGRELGNAGVPDFIVRAANTATGAPAAGNLLGLSAVHSGSGIAGFEYQTTPKLLLYGYFSGIYVERNSGPLNNTAACTSAATCVGYGFTGSSPNANRLLHEGTIGWVQYFWRNPNYGAVSMINQISYMDRYPWAPGGTGANTPKDAHDLTVYVDLRYTLP